MPGNHESSVWAKGAWVVLGTQAFLGLTWEGNLEKEGQEDRAGHSCSENFCGSRVPFPSLYWHRYVDAVSPLAPSAEHRLLVQKCGS